MSTPATPRTRNTQVAKAAKAGQGNRNIWIIVAIVAVVAFAAIIAVALSQESSDDGGDETAEVTVTGDPLPPATTDSQAGVGMTAPELEGTDLSGAPISITNDGQPKVIGFFAHWCPHCQAEVPVIVEWQEDGNQPDDVDFYAVSTSVNPAGDNYPPSSWFEDEGWTTPTMKDDEISTAHLSFGAGGFPYWVAVDADGTVVGQSSGELGYDAITAFFEQARG